MRTVDLRCGFGCKVDPVMCAVDLVMGTVDLVRVT